MVPVAFTLEKKELSVALPKKLDISNSGAILKEMEEKIGNEKFKTFIFDMSECEYISSAGIGILVNITRQLKGKKYNTKIVNYNENIEEVLKITDILSYIGID